MTSTSTSRINLSMTEAGQAAGRMPLPEAAILAMVALMPVMASPPLTAPFFDIPALRLSNLLPVLGFLAFLGLPRPAASHTSQKRIARLLFWAYIALFAVTFARSIGNLPRFAIANPEYAQISTLSYIDTLFVLRVLSAMTFLYALRIVNGERSLERWLWAISAGIFLLSCVVVAGIAQNPAALVSYNRSGILEITNSLLGMHYNNLGTFYIITCPLLVYLASRGHWFWVFNAILAFLAVLLLESRTTIYIFVLMSGVTLVAIGKVRALFVIAPVFLAAAFLVLGPILMDLLSIGFREEAGFSTYFLLSGRGQSIWTPLLTEWMNDPARFWLGAGYQGILTSESRFLGTILTVAQAHNAYIELFLDTGIIVSALFLLVLLIVCFQGWRLGRELNNGLYWALFLCCMAFLVGGLTGRRFFPEPENMLMFPILGALVSVASAIRAQRSRPARPGQPGRLIPSFRKLAGRRRD